MKVKVGDLVKWRDQIYLVLYCNPMMATVANIRREGTTNGFPVHWLTVVSQNKNE